MKISLSPEKKTYTYTKNQKKNGREYTARIKRVPVSRRVYVDESGVNTSLHREYARDPVGTLVEDVKRGTRFDRVNVIGALCNGTYFSVGCYRHATDGVFFQRRFETRLLKEIPKGYTIIMDNARFHWKKQPRGLAGGKVRLLFLPPYSPDYNPIEKSWANMKRFLGNNLRGFQSLDSAILSFFHIPEF